MIIEFIDSIKEWFGDVTERQRTIKEFNDAAKSSFILGEADTLLKAKITGGNPSNKHAFSKWRSGFRITAINGNVFTRMQCTAVGGVILHNESLVRKLLSLGFDTLEVHSDMGGSALQWNLSDFANLGGLLE